MQTLRTLQDINGAVVAVNPAMVAYIEQRGESPTLIHLAGGVLVEVAGTLEEVITALGFGQEAAVEALLAASRDALTVTIGGTSKRCEFCQVKLQGDAPHKHGNHEQWCWVPGMLAAVNAVEGRPGLDPQGNEQGEGTP